MIAPVQDARGGGKRARRQSGCCGLEINRIYRIDCLAGMELIRAGSIDMILTDLPYGVTANQWDVPIDLEQLWTQYKRLVRPTGVIVLTAQCPFDKVLGVSNLRWLKYEWIWEKSRATGFLNAKIAPLKAHENVLVFYKRSPTYDPQFSKGKPYRSGRRKVYHDRNLGRWVEPAPQVNSGYRYPRSVLRIPSETRAVHPTQKPVALFEYLVRTYTKPGELVLDSCMGLGTTAIACLNSGRNFIGFELDREYHRLAEERVRQHRQGLAAGSR